jgi:hypothetical protein
VSEPDPAPAPDPAPVIGYAVVVVRGTDGMHFLERFWVADAADALGARGRALAAAGRLRGHLAPSEEAFVCELRKLPGP